jgi:FHS family glucose/mannose:H+ symporter-like MFS transporter
MSRTFLLLFYLLYFVFALLLNSVGILIYKSLELYNINEWQASSLEAYKDLPIAIVSFGAGIFLSRLGYRLALLISISLVLLACSGMYFFPGFQMSKCLFATVGIGFAVVKICIYGIFGKSKRHLSSIESVFMLGIAAAYIGFPFFEKASDPFAWTRIYLLLAVLLFLILIGITQIEIKDLPTPSTSLKKVKMALRQSSLWLFALCIFLYVMMEQGIMTWLPTYNERVLHLNSGMAIHLALLLSLTLALGRYLVAYPLQKIPSVFILYLSVIGCAVMLFFSKQTAYAFPLIGIFLAPIYPLLNNGMLKSTSEADQATIASLLVFFSALGGTGGARLVGYAFTKTPGFEIILIPLIAFALGIFLLHRKINLYLK